MLFTIPTMDEVKHALFSIGPFKAFGPDGVHALFYQQYWSEVSSDLVEFVQQVFLSP
uniref:Uncharacterized protein n=1 Tax=Nelumbo nucifera TaxID=4432 RepID=A0A822ZIM2_NELNU|nr:TPA_asm: hypothetical protein HUJ06_004194 [Nelumbo nucifera]